MPHGTLRALRGFGQKVLVLDPFQHDSLILLTREGTHGKQTRFVPAAEVQQRKSSQFKRQIVEYSNTNIETICHLGC